MVLGSLLIGGNGLGGFTPAAGQAGRATVMAELFKDMNAGS
jgi:hypothetical protein